MPQLWTETIVTQYFWLIVILLGFYYVAVTKLIPQIAFTLKARRILESAGSDSKITGTVLIDNKDSLLGNTKSLLSSVLTPKLPTIKVNTTDTLVSNINSVRTNWINKHIS